LADNDTEWTHVDRVPDIAVYTGPHGVEQGVGLDESCEPLDFYLNFIDFELIAKVKEQTFILQTKKKAKFKAQNKLGPSSRFRLDNCFPVRNKKVPWYTFTYVHQPKTKH
jgi:hypothetical protein